MWSAYRNVNSVATDVLCFHREEQLVELEESLRTCRIGFLQPMYNPQRAAVDRQAVRKADVESIAIPALSQEILLTRDLIDETCSLSDLFNLNEITALELVLTAEGQLSSHGGGLSRGSLAVSLYFDAHRSLVGTLKTLLHSNKSFQISSRSEQQSHEAFSTINAFTSDIWDSGFLNNLLSFLAKFNVEDELKRLEDARALGGRQHRRDILRLLTEIRNLYAECLLLWSAQRPLSSKEMNQVLSHLVTFRLIPPKRDGEPLDMPALPLDHASIHLVMAVLYSLEPFKTPGIDIDQVSEANDEDLSHPLFTEVGYISAVTTMFTPPSETDAVKTSPAVEGLYGLFELAWSIALRRTAHLRMDLRRRGEARINAENVDEDDLVASALRSNAIEFLSAAVLSAAFFAQELNWVQRAHALLTELLIQFPQNARDIRLWDESVARRTGVDPAGFAVLLDAVSRLYNVPGSPLHARLSLEYWWPAGEAGSSSALLMSDGNTMNASFCRSGDSENSRQAILFRFVYTASEFASAPVIFVPYVRMLRSLVGCQSSANLCFNLLKATASSGGRLASLLTWDHFINSLHQYLEHLQRALPMLGGSQQEPLHIQHPHLYQSGDRSMWQQPTQQQSAAATAALQLEIQPEEVEALRIVVALITRVASMDPIACSAFASNQKWRLLGTSIGLITCPLPMAMKADLFHLLSAISKNPAIGLDVWRALLESRMFAFVESLAHTNPSVVAQRQDIGLNTEMDKVEARAEEYPITQGFINLLITLAPTLLSSSLLCSPSAASTITSSGEVFSRLVNFTLETIFLKHTMRAYRRPNERWEIAASSVVLFEGLVRTFLNKMRAMATLAAGSEACSDDQLAAFNWSNLLSVGTNNPATSNLPRGWPFSDPGYQIVTQLLTHSSLFSLLTGLLEVGLYRLLEFPSNPSACAMVRATAAILRLFEHILPHEQILVNLVRRAALAVPHLRIDGGWGHKSGADVILPNLLSRLLVVTVNSRTGRADLLVTIVRYCGLVNDLPDHSASALNIFYSVIAAVQPHEQVLAVLTNDKKLEQDLLQALVSCLSAAPEFDAPGTMKPAEPIFSDAWICTTANVTAADTQQRVLRSGGGSSHLAPHPALAVARACAAFPTIPADWDLTEARWESMAAFPRESDGGGSSAVDNLWLLRHLAQGKISPIRSTMLHLILYALTRHPSPSIAHWLLGFRCKNARSIALTTLQDAGVGGFPLTCLHFLLDFIETAVASLRESNLGDDDFVGPDSNAEASSVASAPLVAQQWDAAVAWQILYHLMANPRTTGLPISRYLRGNHDLIARHLTTGLIGAHLMVSPVNVGLNPAARALQSIVLNQCSWLLKMSAIELQSVASQRTYLARLLACLFKENDGFGGGDPGFILGPDISADRFSLLHAESQNHHHGGRMLADLVAKISPSEPLTGPQWILDQDHAESKLIEQIILACEEPCHLIPTSDQASLGSGVINTTALRSRLRILCRFNNDNGLDDDFPAEGNTVGVAPSSLGTEVCAWAHCRNDHRLGLVAGKQACLEGWRQSAEVGMRMLHFLARVSPDALAVVGGGSGVGPVAVNRYLYASSMSLLNPLLREVSAPKTAPAVLKVLASGSCLSLTAFLQLFASPTSGDGPLCGQQQHLRGSNGILSIVRLLVEAVLSSKPAQQRVRANYYGALCYALDVCQQLDQQSALSDSIGAVTGTSKDAIKPTLSLQAVNILTSGGTVGVAGFGVESSSAAAAVAAASFLNVLFSDASSGHHPIIPISALALLCLLMKLDRSSGQVLECFIRDGCLQTCVDSLEYDLSILQEAIFRDENTGKPPTRPIDPTAIFYVYHSKMALLALAASSPLGAKVLVQSHLLDVTLCQFEALSESCFADVLNLATVAQPRPLPTTDCSSSYHSLAWLDFHEVARHLLVLVNREEATAAATLMGLTDPLITSQLLSVSGSSLATASVNSCGGANPCWYDLIMPALAVAKAMAFTLGPTHVSAIQKVSKFLYTHSDALLTVRASSSAVLVASVLAHDCFHASITGSGEIAGGDGSPTTSTGERTVAAQSAATTAAAATKTRLEVCAILQWLRGEASLAHLLALVMRARVPPSLGEPEDMPRELLRSKALRHVFAILPGLLQALQSRDNRSLGGAPGSESTRATYERNLITTKEVELLQLLVATCQAAVSTEDELGNAESASLKNLVFSASISSGPSERDASIEAVNGSSGGGGSAATNRPGMGLLIQLAAWAASRLHHLETVITATTRHLPTALNHNTSKKTKLEDTRNDIGGSFEKREMTSTTDGGSLPLDKVLMCLCELPVSNRCLGEDISTDSLRQIAISLFSVWSPASSQLLQAHSVFGIDAAQRTACLRRFIAMGGALLQSQLSSLIDLIEQSLYLLWRHLTCYISVSKHEANSIDLQSSTPNPPRKLTQQDRVQLLEQLPRKLNFDVLDSITQVSKASYLSKNDQLFVQVMAHRLERLSQSTTRLASERNN